MPLAEHTILCAAALMLAATSHAQTTQCAGSGTPIPDGADSAFVTINIPTTPGATVDDLSISIDLAHDWLGDLIITLTHNGQSAILIDQTGASTWAFGCGGNDINATFTDNASTTAQALCIPSGPTPMLAGDILPAQPLSIFDGAPVEGDWTITISDVNPIDLGIINNICINITPAPAPTPCPGDIDNNNTVNLADFNILAVNFGTGPDATPAQGDLNDDGVIDLADFNLLAVNFGNSCN